MVTNLHNGNAATASTARLALDKLYFSLFKMRCRRVKSLDLQVVYNVEMVVWGALHLEALINRVCLEYLQFWMNKAPGGGESVWDAMEQSRIQSKLAMLCVGVRVKKQVARGMAKRLDSILQLRNRLVHFKERPIKMRNRTFIAHHVSFGKKGKLPEPPLLAQLKSPQMLQLRRNVIALSNWLYGFTMEGQPKRMWKKLLREAR